MTLDRRKQSPRAIRPSARSARKPDVSTPEPAKSGAAHRTEGELLMELIVEYEETAAKRKK
jgi:hypothetical protein